ncbi:cytochrome P450 [Synechococcus sp. PCC 7335]|uniref:cytochrome P450 n=1 Tax=Synechococcus sp. (strain ATCC 29403 / PCC 7335) TaxID=91464 RepID=UPI000571A4E4|nr:cytochrome P450 [Synechococcus sp. PCC 7335]
MAKPLAVPTKPTPPGRFGLPVVGESISYLKDPEEFILQRQQQYGNVFKTHLFGSPNVVLIGADAVQFLFSHDGKTLEMTNTPNFETLLGEASIGVQIGAAHQVLRRQLAQAFQPRTLERYAIAMEAVTKQYLQSWAAKGSLTWYDELKKYTLDVACRLFVGVSTQADESLAEIYETWSKGLLSIPVRFPGSPLDKAIRARESLLARFDQLIEQRQYQQAEKKDVLSILLTAKDESGHTLSREAVKDNVLAMLIAGHETLTSALTSLCQQLAQCPDVLSKVKAEQEQLGFPTQMTPAVLNQMTYLEQVVKEVLRLVPPVVRSGSRKVLEDCKFGGYLVPRGWDVYYQIPETHMDSRIYESPEQFDPERFSSERAEDRRKRCGHIPFGGGIRECLGKEFARLEMKIFAALLVRDYRWELVPNQNLERVVLPFSRPQDGLKVLFSANSSDFA